jgi:hypothetical protein
MSTTSPPEHTQEALTPNNPSKRKQVVIHSDASLPRRRLAAVLRNADDWDVEAAKVILGGTLGLGFLAVKWRYMDLESAARRTARQHGFSMVQLAPPGQRWGNDHRCDLWTVLGAFSGALIGAGAGLFLSNTVSGAVALGVVGAVVFAWRYRVVTSILAHAPGQPAPKLFVRSGEVARHRGSTDPPPRG